MNRSELIIPTKDVQLWVTINNTPIRLDTANQLTRTFTQQVDDIFAIGYYDPIGVAKSNSSYTSQLTLQTGEYQVLLNAINATLPLGSDLYASFLQVPNFVLTITYALKNLSVPASVSISLLNCNVDNDSESMSANDTSTSTSLSLKGSGIERRVSLIPLT